MVLFDNDHNGYFVNIPSIYNIILNEYKSYSSPEIITYINSLTSYEVIHVRQVFVTGNNLIYSFLLILFLNMYYTLQPHLT